MLDRLEAAVIAGLIGVTVGFMFGSCAGIDWGRTRQLCTDHGGVIVANHGCVAITPVDTKEKAQ